MKRLFLLICLAHAGDQPSTIDDKLPEIRFMFGMRHAAAIKACVGTGRATGDNQQCKNSLASLRAWLNEQPFEISEKERLHKCIDDTQHLLNK